MLKLSAEFELRKRYALGERTFNQARLRKAELRGMNLSHTSLRGSDLSAANLRGVNLSYADLRECNLNEADLMGANLTGANLNKAFLIKTYLTKANLYKTKLNEACLTGAFLTYVNLTQADLTGAYLNGADLSGANLQGSLYSEQTCFDRHFNPVSAGMRNISTLKPVIEKNIPIEELLTSFNAISQCSNHYLGPSLTAKYLQSSRPEFEWLKKFNINSKAQLSFSGNTKDSVTTRQLKLFQQWVKAFIKSCSLIIQDFNKIIIASQNVNKYQYFLQLNP